MNKNKTPILTTGLNGLVGQRISELLSTEYLFNNLSQEKGYDITSLPTIESRFKQGKENWVWHLAAATDVDLCEKEADWAYKTNVLGTKNIVDLCVKYKKRLLFVSTDFVFSGKNKIYSEKDTPDPINVYGKTKYEAEKLVKKMGKESLIVRISFPYCATNPLKKDFFHVILEKLRKKERVMAVNNVWFTPTFIDDISKAFSFLTKKEAGGLYHVVGSSSHTPLDASLLIAEKFGLNKSLILPCARSDFYQNRAPRPCYLRISNDKIKKLGIIMRDFPGVLTGIKP